MARGASAFGSRSPSYPQVTAGFAPKPVMGALGTAMCSPFGWRRLTAAGPTPPGARLPRRTWGATCSGSEPGTPGAA